MNEILTALQTWNHLPDESLSLEAYLSAGLRRLVKSTAGRRALLVCPPPEAGGSPLEVGVTAEGASCTPRDIPSWEDYLAGGRTPPPDIVIVPLPDTPGGHLYLEGSAPLDETARTLAHTFGIRAALLCTASRWKTAYAEARKEKAAYVSVVSHELRLPMTSIKGYTDLMLKGMTGTLNEMQTNFLGVIRNNVERMSRLITNLSDLSKAEEGRLKLQISAFPPREAAEKAAAAIRGALEERQQRFVQDIPADLPYVQADPQRVSEILDILLRNAVLYTPEGGEIRLAARQEGNGILLEVSDNGMGITEADAERIFERFFRSEDQRVRDHPGWGLGLSVARMLVELQGGTLTFESRAEGGSTFQVRLPAAPAPPQEGAQA